MAGEQTRRDKVKELEKKLKFEQTLRNLTNKIHSLSLDEIIIHLRDDITELTHCERVTVYAKDNIKEEIFSKFKDGTEIKEFRVPITASSISGYVALTKKTIRINNVYDANELYKIDPNLKFDSSWDKRSGFHTQAVLVTPIMKDSRLFGVIQIINSKDGKSFSEEDEHILSELAKTLAIAFHNQSKINIRCSRFDYLMTNEIISGATLDEAQALAQKQGTSIENILITTFKIPKIEIARSLSEFFRCEFVGFSESIPIPQQLLEKFTLDYLKYHVAVPIGEENGKVVVLMENPRNIVTHDSIQRYIDWKDIITKVSTREDIFSFIDYFYGKAPTEAKQETITEILDELKEEERTEEVKEEETEAPKESDSGIVKLVNQIIEQAAAKGASDIHVEPYLDKDVLVRFRVDGICLEYARLPRRYAKAIIARIKIMSDLDIAERRLPQDGKIRFKNFGALDIELRVATIPTTGGVEDAVMRILASSKPLTLEELTMSPENLENFRKVISQPYGIILCVGPTGSGKTTTLHAAMGYLNTPDMKIWTAEDPVEITQRGLRQVQVHPKIGFTFERALRSFLRADPDVIMIGEMRDAETAGAAVEASLTGHLVLSTLHTNNAPETVTRLLDLGLDPYAFGDSLLAVLAQRLVRKVCKECKETYKPSKEELQQIIEEYGDPNILTKLGIDPDKVELARGKGCQRCNNTGYKGRLGIHELLVVDDDIKHLIYRKAQSSEIRESAIRKGMTLLKQDGIKKVLKGITDFKEIRSACTM